MEKVDKGKEADKRFEEDPKIVARNERRTPEVEKLLRPYLNLDGPKGTTKKFRDNFDRVFKTEPHPNEPPVETAEALQNAGPREDAHAPLDPLREAMKAALQELVENRSHAAFIILRNALDA